MQYSRFKKYNLYRKGDNHVVIVYKAISCRENPIFRQTYADDYEDEVDKVDSVENIRRGTCSKPHMQHQLWIVVLSEWVSEGVIQLDGVLKS